MVKVGYVYKLYTLENDKIYIGSTIDLENRLNKHRSKREKSNSRFLTDNRKSILCEVLEKVEFEDKEVLLRAEMEQIRKHENVVNQNKFLKIERKEISLEKKLKTIRDLALQGESGLQTIRIWFLGEEIPTKPIEVPFRNEIQDI